MADLEDLNAVGMHLERLHTDGHFTAILPVLDRLASARVCLGDLRKTAIARCVSGLERGCADASVRAKARSLLRSWNRVCALSCDPEAEGQSSPETKRNKWLPDGLCHTVGHNRTASDGDESQGGGCADFGDESCARLTIDASSQSLQQHLRDVYTDQNLSVPTTGGDNAETTNLTVCELSGGNSLMATVSENVNSCAQSGNVNLCAQSGNVDSCAQSGNVNSCAQSGNINSCAQSGNVNSCAQSGNINSCAQSGNVNSCAQSGNIDSCAQSGNVNSCAQSGNVDSCTQSGNVDSCAQSGNVNSCAQALKADTVTGKVNVTRCNRTETDPHANELPEDVNIKPTQACSMQAVREKGIQLLYKGLLGIDTRSVAPSGSCKPFCGSANNIAECPELSRESTETLGSHSLSGDVKSCVVHGSAGERRTGPHIPDSSVVETEPSEEESKGDKTHLIELAKEIERAIFGLHPSVDKKYRACLRSKIANLRHPQNGELAGRVRAGAVSPAQFAAMTPEEMACSELRHLRDSYQQAALREHQLPHRPGGTRTDCVRCRRCGKFNCSVSVVCRGTLFIPGWVRGDSPDEQLMTFLTCEECGEKWYNAGWMVT
ncbi:uncharacterized protein LOC144937703 [Lampetra fluviatilis]